MSRAESDVAAIETRIKDRDRELADPVLYQNFARWNDLHLEQDRWKRDLGRLTAQWERLAEELENVKKKLAVAG
ncbi:MAG: hypothetical protein HZB35_07580 [Nitrospirae bacterium]|nr:hypothetical protein [Nitrospirota bacterium]